MPLSDDESSQLITMYQGIDNADKKTEFLKLIDEFKKTKKPSEYDLRIFNDYIENLTIPYKDLSHKGGKRRRTCRKRILNKKPMHKSMHRGRCGKRRSFRKY
jgi:hypothetical protein